MFFGLDTEKLLLLGVIAALIIGPSRLPKVMAGFAQFVARAREWTKDAKGRIKDEMGDDFDDVDWRKLDPRQYDPRRIIRQALLEEPAPKTDVSVNSVADAAPDAAATDAGTDEASTSPAPRVALDPIVPKSDPVVPKPPAPEAPTQNPVPATGQTTG